MFGLNRVITLYGPDGALIKSWEGKFQVEQNGSTARFIYNNKTIIINGTYLIEEK